MPRQNSRFHPARLLAIVIAATLMPSASAWNAAGHRISVAAAWPALSPAAREAVVALLAAHPERVRWERRVREPWPGALLAEAATWPDELRREARERAGRDGVPEDATPAHRDWHFLDWPLGAPIARARGGELDRQLPRLAQRVGDRTAPAAERAEALAWLVHLVGDAHMPLHVADWRDANGEWTAGGNGVPLADPGHPRRAETNLHRFWDDLPGPPWLRGTPLLRRAAALPAVPAAAAAADFPAWLAESHALAGEIVSWPSATPGVVDTAYRERAAAAAERQLALAGARLARLLNALLD